jgi:hypothetical protein
MGWLEEINYGNSDPLVYLTHPASISEVARTEVFRAKALQKLPMLQRVDPDCNLSLRAIAERLTDIGVPTVTGKSVWSANGVRRLKLLASEIRGQSNSRGGK